jgi:hypothetical protein
VIGERLSRRQRVLDRGQFLDLRRCSRPIPVVKVIAEEVLVVLVIPRVGLLLCRLLLLFFGGRLNRLELLRRDLLEHRVLDHLLVQQFRQLER